MLCNQERKFSKDVQAHFKDEQESAHGEEV